MNQHKLMLWKTALPQWGATKLHTHHTFMDGFAPMEQAQRRPLDTDLFVSALLPRQAFCRMARLQAGSDLCSLTQWHQLYGERMHPFSHELGAFLRVDLHPGLESWPEHGDSLCHSKKETANNWEREVPRAWSGNQNLQQGQHGSSRWVWVTEEQLGVKIWSWSNMLLYVTEASLLGSEQRRLCQFATVTVQRLWVPWHDRTGLFSSGVPVLPSTPRLCSSQLLPGARVRVVWHRLK